MGQLEGKVAMVTAGGSGLGRASAMEMAKRGASILVTDINADTAATVAQEIVEAGGKAVSAACDIGVEEQIAAAVGLAVATFGGLQVMHNNAAFITLESIEEDIDILTISTETWDRAMTVTLRGTMLCCRYGIRAMLENGGGSIINTSSMYGVSAFYRQPAYGTSKAAVNFLSQQIATAFGRRGIRCNAVAPSMIRTPTLEAATPAELIEVNADETVTPFLGEPQDVANIVAFLASDESRYITGQTIRADGGSTIHLPTYSATRRYYGE
ncbi:MAG: hypothetical protein JWO15_2247 [Sphingomonadales bacterium]|nr:hypothetical protein [Sphingomonadales bacterium]